ARGAAVRARGQAPEVKVAMRHAARNRGRSVLTASLLAPAAFGLVAGAAGQQEPLGDPPQRRPRNGGGTVDAGTSIPILYDLNSREGLAKLGFDLSDEKQMQLVGSARFYPFRAKPGENASCLNLYQTRLPTVLGVPHDVLTEMDAEDRFLFA